MVCTSGAASLTRGTVHCHNEGVGIDRANSDPSAEWWTTSDVAAYLGLRVAEWHQQRPRPGVGGRPVADSDLPLGQKADGVELTPARANAILQKASAATGLDSDGARLLRIGSNAVYRLKAPVVARVSRYGASVDQAERSVAVARWLASVNFPAVRTADVDQPVIADGHVVTFWNAISDDGDQYASMREVAEVFAKMHALTAPDSLRLPPLTPFENAAHRIEVNDWLSPEDRTFLTNSLPSCKTIMRAWSSCFRRA